jgi:hypothetical protein
MGKLSGTMNSNSWRVAADWRRDCIFLLRCGLFDIQQHKASSPNLDARLLHPATLRTTRTRTYFDRDHV